jgi:hypothetical protein
VQKKTEIEQQYITSTLVKKFTIIMRPEKGKFPDTQRSLFDCLKLVKLIFVLKFWKLFRASQEHMNQTQIEC